jgi:hypothetical protein
VNEFESCILPGVMTLVVEELLFPTCFYLNRYHGSAQNYLYMEKINICQSFRKQHLVVNFPQVVSRILFYNEMLINLECNFNSITLGGNPQSKKCRHFNQER